MAKENKEKWQWKDTALSHVIGITSPVLSVDDLKVLISTRGGKKSKHATKISLQMELIRNYQVELNQELQKLTNKQLLAELKLRGLNNKSAKKSILIQRLKEAKPERRYGSKRDEGKWAWKESIPSGCSDNTAKYCSKNNQEIYLVKPGRDIHGTHRKDGAGGIIWKYSNNINKWTKWINTDLYQASCFDNINQDIYTLNWNAKYLTKTNMITMKSNHSLLSLNINDVIGAKAHIKMVFCNGKIHVILGSTKFLHFAIDTTTADFKCELIHVFGDFAMYRDSIEELIAVPSRKMLMLFRKGTARSGDCSVHTYCLVTDEWSLSELKLTGLATTKDKSLLQFGAAFNCRNERYIIILGGAYHKGRYNWWSVDSKDIYCIDLYAMKLFRSKVILPKKSHYYKGIIMDNEPARKDIVFGYIRRCWKEDGFKRLRMMPDYLIRSIALWYSRENLHITGENRLHCAINLDCILNNLVDI